MKIRTWTEVSLDDISHNFNEIKAVTGSASKIMAVVKADAYGHGAREVGMLMQSLGAGFLGVSSIDEALELRGSGVTMPILILGYTDPGLTSILIDNDLTQTVYSIEFARRFSDAALAIRKCLRIHIKVDTGMSRLGFYENGEGLSTAGIIEAASLAGLIAEGIFSHLAFSDDTEGGFTELQLKRFDNCLGLLKRAGISFRVRHCANSSAVLNYHSSQYDLVRPGIIMYGVSGAKTKSDLDLRPAMCMKSVVSQIKTVSKGEKIGYSCTFEAENDMVIGVVPAGYADGVPWALSNAGIVGIGGETAPIVGRVCMDMFMIDLSAVKNARVGDVVTLFGGRDQRLSAESVAERAGTIPYEILCRISRRVPRIYYSSGEIIKTVNYLNGV